MAAPMIAGAGMAGAGDGIGEAAGEAIETAGEVLRDLLRPTAVSPLPSLGAMPVSVATPEGTKQLRMILRQRTKEARINAQAQMISTLLASPVAMIVVAYGSTVAARGSLQTVAKNTSLSPEIRAAAEAMLGELPGIPSVKMPTLGDLGTGFIPSMPSLPNPIAAVDPARILGASAQGAAFATSPAYMAYMNLKGKI